MREVLQHAARLGVSVHGAYLDPGVLGEYYAEEREVYFDLRLTPIEKRCAIAHELGHVHHGHACEDDPRAEQQADIYAARALIAPDHYSQLERHGLNHHDIAEELGVTEDLLHLWMQHCLVKMRGLTYVLSRMGVGQWRHRETVA